MINNIVHCLWAAFPSSGSDSFLILLLKDRLLVGRVILAINAVSITTATRCVCLQMRCFFLDIRRSSSTMPLSSYLRANSASAANSLEVRKFCTILFRRMAGPQAPFGLVDWCPSSLFDASLDF